MTQPIIVGYVLLSGLLWWMGGWGVIPPGKSWRRHVLPAVTIGFTLFMGAAWWRSLLCGALQVGANTNGYGEDDPMWKRALTLVLLGVPALALDISLWWFTPIYVATIFGTHYFISRKWNRFSWPLVETMAGCAQGVSIVLGVLK